MTEMQEPPTIGPIARYEQNIIERISDFNDPRQEWRRLFSELLGTFFLVLAAAGGGMMGHAFPGVISHTAAVVAPALTVYIALAGLWGSPISGASMNPARTFGPDLVSTTYWLLGVHRGSSSESRARRHHRLRLAWSRRQ